jgi:hypothetical protein
MTGLRIALPLAVALGCAFAAFLVVPRGFEANSLLMAQDNPEKLAERMLDRTFSAPVAQREIEAALKADDADLAQSFLDLARDRHVPVEPALAAKVAEANSVAATAKRAAGSFGRGLVTGEPEDAMGFAGTALGDLFVFGDIRDAAREGKRLAMGEPTDEVLLGLACVGLAITAGTYATVGIAAPARAGLTLVKAARKTGRLSAHMAAWLGHSLREVVDWSAVGRAVGSATLARPLVAVRAARAAVKGEKAHDLVRLVGDVGRVQGKAGTQAALDGLKLAQAPRDVSRVAKIAEKYGGKTRAVLKLGGRAAILLAASAFDLFSWMLAAVMTVLGFCASCKRAAERATERYLLRRKARRLRALDRVPPLAAARAT